MARVCTSHQASYYFPATVRDLHDASYSRLGASIYN